MEYLNQRNEKILQLITTEESDKILSYTKISIGINGVSDGPLPCVLR
ncbi:hypothetical protein T01_9652 [Trichinella spiralis]|uniref:Uncharacterized protein n=1 Tax=Trichinella spiralis TaxID=6334 RepID=A0A0V1AIQ9_TRISP|nr:hypothetical protein T01_9652 [Trichinella spiralis]